MIPLSLAPHCTRSMTRACRSPGRCRSTRANIAPDGLFACLNGRALDGHTFAAQAVADGAVTALASRPVDAPAVIVPDMLDTMGLIARAVATHYNGTVLALTGSAGKTSTKDILETVLSLDGPTVANAKSFNNEIGFPVTISRVMPDSRYLVLRWAPAARATERMITTIRSAGLDATHAEMAVNLAEHVNAELQSGDVVLVKGANALGLEMTARELIDMRPPAGQPEPAAR